MLTRLGSLLLASVSCFAAAPFLDHKYTVFGEVVSGMEFVDQVKMGTQQNNGAVSDPTKIVKAELASDDKTKK